ncbi:hypothetical protein K2173_004823 [Erythroxylum novogranatense]|uniref:Uncharacterized protein n=1 Tax=Erythroxylum novogranatense TaxID=1862640 RepID=A0AAV8SKV6_9ROSI|nr:hypothetical protein K2173_004823 [Erythroxylum novogranatense]
MPSYAKFLKEILSNKRKLEEHETVALTVECSAAIQNKLPPKLKDPGSFSIPWSSVSLMPLSLCRKLDLGELTPTTIALQLADRSVKYSVGVLEDGPIKVGNLYVPVDFVILEMEKDTRTPIILGRPFLATVGCQIDVKNGKLSFEIGEDCVQFDLSKATKFTSLSNDCCRIDIIYSIVNAHLSDPHSADFLEQC